MEELVKYFVLPSNLIIILFIIGSILLLARKARRLSFSLLATAGLLYSTVNSSSAFRIIEAIRIFKYFPHAEILISGQGDVAEVMKRLAVVLGLPSNQVTIESQSTSTYESAVNAQTILACRPFVLVTSAGHMPRAMGVFLKLGMNPIPAPTDYMTRKNYLAVKYLPSPLHLRYSDLAVHEYLAILWYRLKKRF